jgi:hypothetical protein
VFVIALIIPAILPAVALDLLTSYLVTRFLVSTWLEITITYTSIPAEPVPVRLLRQLEITSAREAWPELRHYQQIGSFELHRLPFFCSNIIFRWVSVARWSSHHHSRPQTEIINIHITVYRYILYVHRKQPQTT